MNFVDFRKKLAGDKEFAGKFADCSTPAKLVEAAAKEGYTFTVDDINNATELIPEELAVAAGGTRSIASSHWLIIPEHIINP